MNVIKPKLLIVSFTDATKDPRVWRQIVYLKDDYQITVAGLADPKIDGVKWLPIVRRLKKCALIKVYFALTLLLHCYSHFRRRYILKDILSTSSMRFDVVICNDLYPLPLVFKIVRNVPVIFDAHEYYPRQEEQSFFWRLIFQKDILRLCREYIPKCAAMTTVCDGLANEYHRQFGVMPVVVHSGPDLQNLTLTQPCGEHIRLIHHGGASPARCIELMIEMMQYLDERFTLDLMLVGSGAYYDKIKKMALKSQRVNWREPVPMTEISGTCNQYDIGLYILKPTNFNTEHALPNKFFEYIQARLAIAIGPSVEMARLVMKEDIGVVAEDFSPQTLAKELNKLTISDIMRYKQNADKVARQYNAESEMQKLKKLLTEVVNTYR